MYDYSENPDWSDNEYNKEPYVVTDGVISDDGDHENISETSSEEISKLLKLATYHSGNCSEFANTLEQSSSENIEDTDLKGRTAFLHLAMFGCEKCLSKLYRLCKNININQADDDKCTALMAAAASGNSEVVKLLLSWSPDVNVRDTSKNTALHHSVSSDRDKFSIESVHLLLQYYCDVNALNDTQPTPLLQSTFAGKSLARM